VHYNNIRRTRTLYRPPTQTKAAAAADAFSFSFSSSYTVIRLRMMKGRVEGGYRARMECEIKMASSYIAWTGTFITLYTYMRSRAKTWRDMYLYVYIYIHTHTRVYGERKGKWSYKRSAVERMEKKNFMRRKSLLVRCYNAARARYFDRRFFRSHFLFCQAHNIV